MIFLQLFYEYSVNFFNYSNIYHLNFLRSYLKLSIKYTNRTKDELL